MAWTGDALGLCEDRVFIDDELIWADVANDGLFRVGRYDPIVRGLAREQILSAGCEDLQKEIFRDMSEKVYPKEAFQTYPRLKYVEALSQGKIGLIKGSKLVTLKPVIYRRTDPELVYDVFQTVPLPHDTELVPA